MSMNRDLTNRNYMKDGNFVSEPWPDSGNYSDPTEHMLQDPLWNAIWEEIKHWDINVPSQHAGYTEATGNHATAIYRAISAIIPAVPPAAPKEHVAWLRYRHNSSGNVTIHLCDSDSPGAFKVYREPKAISAATGG